MWKKWNYSYPFTEIREKQIGHLTTLLKEILINVKKLKIKFQNEWSHSLQTTFSKVIFIRGTKQHKRSKYNHNLVRDFHTSKVKYKENNSLP